FVFQAEDGIRDRNVTGVQTCALPIFFLLFLLGLLPMQVQASTHYPLQMKYPDTMMYKADTNEKVIAFTFDDAPDEIYTPRILDVLKKHDAKATFFLLGARVEKYPHIVRQIHEEGHIIGNHT